MKNIISIISLYLYEAFLLLHSLQRISVTEKVIYLRSQLRKLYCVVGRRMKNEYGALVE